MWDKESKRSKFCVSAAPCPSRASRSPGRRCRCAPAGRAMNDLSGLPKMTTSRSASMQDDTRRGAALRQAPLRVDGAGLPARLAMRGRTMLLYFHSSASLRCKRAANVLLLALTSRRDQRKTSDPECEFRSETIPLDPRGRSLHVK